MWTPENRSLHEPMFLTEVGPGRRRLQILVVDDGVIAEPRARRRLAHIGGGRLEGC